VESEPGEVVATLKALGQGVAMLPQPYVTAAAAQLGEGFRTVLSVSDEWDALSDGSRCVTAGIIVRREFAQAHPEAVETFLREYAASADWVNANPAQAGEYCEELNIAKAAVSAKAIPYCNIVCITGAEMRAAAEGCLGVLYGLNPAAVGGALPGEDFYFGAA
jgi:NitT/TauT family transport system substrate-binding protein